MQTGDKKEHADNKLGEQYAAVVNCVQFAGLRQRFYRLVAGEWTGYDEGQKRKIV
jgi:hypothetical protein